MYMNVLENEVESLSAEVTRLRLMLHRVTDTMASMHSGIPVAAPPALPLSAYRTPPAAALVSAAPPPPYYTSSGADAMALYQQWVASRRTKEKKRHARRAETKRGHRSRRRHHREETPSSERSFDSGRSAYSDEDDTESYTSDEPTPPSKPHKKKRDQELVNPRKTHQELHRSRLQTSAHEETKLLPSSSTAPSPSQNYSKGEPLARERSESAPATSSSTRSAAPTSGTTLLTVTPTPSPTALPLAPKKSVSSTLTPAVKTTTPSAGTTPASKPVPFSSGSKATAPNTVASKTAPATAGVSSAATFSKAPPAAATSPTILSATKRSPVARVEDGSSSDDGFPGLPGGLKPLQAAALISPTRAVGVRTPQSARGLPADSSSDSATSESSSSSDRSISAEFDKVMGNTRPALKASQLSPVAASSRNPPATLHAVTGSVPTMATSPTRDTTSRPPSVIAAATPLSNYSASSQGRATPSSTSPNQMSFSVARDMYSSALTFSQTPPVVPSGIPRPSSAIPTRSTPAPAAPAKQSAQPKSPGDPQARSPSKRFQTRAEAVHPLSPSRTNKQAKVTEATKPNGNFISPDILDTVENTSSNPNDQSRNSDDLRKNFYCGAAL